MNNWIVMFKISYRFSADYLKKLRIEKNLEKIRRFVLYPEGILILKDNKVSTQNLIMNPDVFFFWLVHTIMDFKKSKSQEYEADFNDLPFYYRLKNDLLSVRNNKDELVADFSVTKDEFAQALIECAKKIRITMEFYNKSVKQIKEWQGLDFNRFD